MYGEEVCRWVYGRIRTEPSIVVIHRSRKDILMPIQHNEDRL